MASGIWDKIEYQKLPAYDGEIHEQTATAVFMCHQPAEGHVCSGRLGHRKYPEDMLAVRLGLIRGTLDQSCLDYSTDVPLFESGAAAAEHGMKHFLDPQEDARSVIRKITRKRAATAAPTAITSRRTPQGSRVLNRPRRSSHEPQQERPARRPQAPSNEHLQLRLL